MTGRAQFHFKSEVRRPVRYWAVPSPDASTVDERIWYRVDLEVARALVAEYPLWKDGPWYGRVDWRRITTALDEVLQCSCRDGAITWDELMTHIRPIERRLGKTDREGLESLLLYPIEVTKGQLHNGGHRLTAMLTQNVRFVPGCCMRGDIGEGIDADQVYPCITPPARRPAERAPA